MGLTNTLLKWSNIFYGPKVKVEKYGSGYYYSFQDNNPVEMPFKTNFEIFRNIPHLRAVIEKKATMESNVKFVVQHEDTDEVDYKHPLNKMLLHPNGFQTWKQFMYMISIYKSVAAIAFVAPKFGISESARHLTELKPIDFEDFEIVKKKGKLAVACDNPEDLISRYVFHFDDNLTTYYQPEELFTLKDTYFSYTKVSSRITSNMIPIENIYKSLINRGILMDAKGGKGIISGGQKDGGVSVPFKSGEKDAIQERINSYGIGPNKKEVIVTDVPLNWQAMVFPTNQLMLHEEEVADFNTLCDAWQIHREIFAGSTTFSNKEQATAATYEDGILPSWNDTFASLQKSLKLYEEKRIILPDYSHIRYLAKTENEKLDSQQKKSSMLINEFDKGLIDLAEYRDQMGYEPRPDLEKAKLKAMQAQLQPPTVDIDAEVIEDPKQLK